MDLPVLVDSNVYIDLLRQRLDPALKLTRRVSQLDLATCGMVRVEVLRGIKIEKVLPLRISSSPAASAGSEPSS